MRSRLLRQILRYWDIEEKGKIAFHEAKRPRLGGESRSTERSVKSKTISLDSGKNPEEASLYPRAILGCR